MKPKPANELIKMAQATSTPVHIYIAGPMRGYEYFNSNAFDQAENQLDSFGIHGVSPRKLDLCMGFDAMKLPLTTDWNFTPADIRAMIQRDVMALLQCDGVYLLNNWENSKGALAEKAVAESCLIPTFYGELEL